MRKPENLDARLTILMGPTEKELLRELAYLRRMTMGQVVRSVLRETLERELAKEAAEDERVAALVP